MIRRTALPNLAVLVIQMLLLIVAAIMLAAWPPRSGRLMLVALDDTAIARIVPIAIAAHALLIGPGPWQRSYVVDGDRATIRAALPTGVILLAAPAAGCDGDAAA